MLCTHENSDVINQLDGIYIWYSPQKSKYPLFILEMFHFGLSEGRKPVYEIVLMKSSNLSAQLQRLARILILTCSKRITNALIRQRGYQASLRHCCSHAKNLGFLLLRPMYTKSDPCIFRQDKTTLEFYTRGSSNPKV